MNRMGATHGQQRDFTLLELLMGLTVSLIVLAATLTALGISKQTWTAMAAADAVFANSRMVFRNLREHSQLAGAAYLKSSNLLDGRFSVEISTNEEPGQAAIAGINGSKSVESVTLGHWHALDTIDCQGNTSSTHTTVRNDYKLNTNKELTCKDLNGTNSTYQALAEGVEDFQVRYAETQPTTQTLQWKTAQQVIAMSQVVAIEVCVTVASPAPIHASKLNAAVTGCQGEAPPADGRFRRTIQRVMALRNRDGVLP